MASPPVGFPLRTKAASSVDDNWNLVVKVKYGDTLRRFYAYVRQGSMDRNMAKLKEKIVGLFEFKHDAQLVLTYIDSDGDEVALDNDDELHDAAIHQHLNPLRIYVKFEPRGDAKPEIKLGATNYYSSGLSTAVLQSLQANPSVSEALKSIPQPLQSALLKKSHDFASKAASFSTACQGFLEYFSKLGLPAASLVASCPPAGSDINDDPVVEALVKELEEMGFKQINLNKEVLRLNINDNPVEETLLKELEEMGFKETYLNKEVLRLNKYDLVQSVDDLCGLAEWKQQMGFNDKELNK